MNKAFSAILMLTAILFSCRKEAPPVPVQSQSPMTAKAAVSKITPEAEVKTENNKIESETYLYTPQGRRDPFLSIIEATKKEREAERKRRKVRPAEAYDAADINVIAIARDKEEYYAMVQLPDKKYFTVKEGMTLGLYGGKVTKINAQGVILREYIKNYKGELLAKDTILKLRKEGEE